MVELNLKTVALALTVLAFVPAAGHADDVKIADPFKKIGELESKIQDFQSKAKDAADGVKTVYNNLDTLAAQTTDEAVKKALAEDKVALEAPVKILEDMTKL